MIERYLGHSTSNGPVVPTSPSPISMKFYQLIQMPFKLGSVKFRLQIINGWCTSITIVEETFVAEGFFTINSKVYRYFPAQPDKQQA